MRCETMVGLQVKERNSIIEECTITMDDTMVQGSSFRQLWLVSKKINSKQERATTVFVFHSLRSILPSNRYGTMECLD